jgi:large subunit ribosomal protein L15
MSMIHEITKLAPRNKRRKRKGRGESSGHGKTSGRGTKGSKARVGTYIKRGHEGGQTPIFRRLPKRGFSNYDFESRFYIVNLADLNTFDEGATVDALMLKERGLIPDLKQPVKILGDGKLTRKLTVIAGWYSKSAIEKIAAAGGTVQNAEGKAFVLPKPRTHLVPKLPKPKAAEAKPAEEQAPAAEEVPAKPKPEAGAEKPE